MAAFQVPDGSYIVAPGGPNNDLPGGGDYIDNSLPDTEGPVDPGYGYPLPPVIDNGLPATPGRPSHPIQPTYPVDPGYGLPVAPGIWPQPPLGTWPPTPPLLPSHPIYPTGPGGHPSHPIALPPGHVWPPLPPSVTGTIIAFCWIVGVGYRWVCIDPSPHPIVPGGERPSQGLPQPPRPGQALPPAAQPKT